MDTEHWFSPLIDRTGGVDAEQYLYLSTNRTTPFTVEIYNHNTLYKTVKISKGNPGKIYIDRELMITDGYGDLFTPNKMGLHLVGEYKFFAHFRFAVRNHAEIITSKGKAALGKVFYAAMAENPVGRSYVNSSIGITATEDKTSVKLSGYNAGVVFSNGVDGVSSPNLNTVLNKGESYIVDVISETSQANLFGLIGTKIEADKPITVTNGNFDAISPNKNNIDIVMDQSIPIERLGKQFVVMNGNGSKTSPNPSFTGMEKTIIVATEDNTTFYLNNNTTPITINKAGEYRIIESTDYISQSNDVFSLYINSNKNIYVYQHLAGNKTGTEFASAGFNLIPPLACLLPNKIDEFGLINEIGSTTYDTKLNIIAEKGAKVQVNNMVLSGNNGPFPIAGNPDWETYFYPYATGNVTVTADKAITAGIAAGNGAVGYGGYFAGFNSNPIVTKGGDCEKGNITLEVDDTFDSYQWYYNGVPYTGPGANTYLIKPTESGEYYVKIMKNNCGTMDSPIFKLQKCPYKSNVDALVSDCAPEYITFPKFSESSQTIDFSSIKITTPPTNGTVTINQTTGEIKYTLTNLSALSDSFTYSFSGTDPNFPDKEFITVKITVNHLKTIRGKVLACIKPDKTGDFNLTEAVVSNDTNITKVEYYENYDASTKTFTNLITNFTSYNSIPKTIYAKVTNSFGCSDVAEIDLNFYPIPNIDTVQFNSTLCDDDFDGLYEPDFDLISKTIVNNSADFDIYYFNNPGLNFPALPKDWTYTSPTRVYVLVASRNGCTNATGYIDFKIGPKITVTDVSKQICDGDFNNTENIDLKDYLPQITSETNYTFAFYLTKNDADLEKNPVQSLHNITSNSTFYVRIKKTGLCDNIATINLKFGQPSKSTTLPEKITICEGTTTTLDAGTNFIQYLWSNGATTQTITVGKGDYSVILTSANGCTYTQKVSVVESPKAIIDLSKFNTTICDNNLDNKIEVNLDTVTSAILINPGIYRVKYYNDITNANIGNALTLNTSWFYTTDTSIFVRIESDYCPAQIYMLNFKFGNKIPLLSSGNTVEVCDDNLDGIKSVNLKDFVSLYTNDNNVSVSFHSTESDAKNKANSISNLNNITNSGTYYLRFESNNACANWAKITVTVKIPKSSSSLPNVEICENATTILNAGTDFDYYSWYNATNMSTPILQGNAATASKVTVPVGNYFVDLKSGSCTYRQSVTVSKAISPVIESVIEQDNTILVNVSGGNPPYEYSLDLINWQASNFFSNVKRGIQKVYVRDKKMCTPVEAEFTIINLINAITPNGDGVNDVLDYSDLKTKKEVKIQIFDRYGMQIYTSKNQNSFIWNGLSSSNRPIPTGTYWYVLEWLEPDTNIKMNFKGWILVKNRN